MYLQAAVQSPALEEFPPRALGSLRALAGVMLGARHTACLDVYVQVCVRVLCVRAVFVCGGGGEGVVLGAHAYTQYTYTQCMSARHNAACDLLLPVCRYIPSIFLFGILFYLPYYYTPSTYRIATNLW